ncbi:MAG: MFS transporter [Nitrososphaeria archaeon]
MNIFRDLHTEPDHHLVSRLALEVLPLPLEIALVATSIYLPLYSYRLGASELVVGFVGATQSVTYIFMPFFAGILSARLGQRKMLFIGSVITSLTYMFYFFVSQPILFIPARAVEGFGWSFIWPTLEARAGESLRRLRIYNIMWGIGSTVAPYLGGVLSQMTDLTSIFAVSLSTTMFSFLVSTIMPGGVQCQKTTEHGTRTRIKRVITSSLFFYGFLYAFTSLIIVTFFPIYCETRNMSVENVGYALTTMNLGRIIAFLAPVHARNIFGKGRTPIICAAFVSFFSLVVIFDTLIQYLYVELFLLGFSLGIMYSVVLGEIMIMAGEQRGYYAGVFESILGTGFFLGPFLGGVVASFAIEYAFAMPTVSTGSFLVLKCYKTLKSQF